MAFIRKFNGTTDKTIQLGSKENPNKKESIEGYFLGTKDIPDSGYGVGKLHVFQTKEGSVGVWGKTNSNRLLTSELKGQMVRLTFTGMGEKKKGKNPAYNYELEHDPENTINVSTVDVNSSEPEESDEEYVASTKGGGTDDGESDEPAPAVSSHKRIQAMLNARKSGNSAAA